MNEEKIRSFNDYKKAFIERPSLIDSVKPYIGKDIIKVFTGQRRVGKSYLLFQLGELILANKQQSNIIYINMELAEFDFIHDHSDLLNYVENRISGKND